MAPCADCLRELQDPSDRRFRYPFLNCTRCGPRLTVLRGLPYDRSSTTLAGFPLCAECRAEFDDPKDRRHHAQPIACPACGPTLVLLDAQRHDASRGDPLGAALTALGEGKLLGIKGLGGFHLACDATDEAAVMRLRQRKRRDDKPFALLVADLDAASALVELDAMARALLEDPARPIVLLRAHQGAAVAPSVAPEGGLMLPSTPLHHLLAIGFARPLVMTSGNLSDEPIAYLDDDAFARLSTVADLFLTHDRPIEIRCDDSIGRPHRSGPIPLRRSRGQAPLPLTLAHCLAVPTLALGGQL